MLFERFHQHPVLHAVWIATVLLWMLPEMLLSRRLRSSKTAQKADRGSKLVVYLGVYAGITLGFFVASRFPAFDSPYHWYALFAAGIGLLWFGIAFRLYAIRVLGQFFTFDVAISSGQRVVEAGPYRWLRHPSYTGSLCSMLGLGFTFGNWLALPVPLLCLAAAYAYRIPVEERALENGLGQPYADYRSRTWRLVPYIF